MYEKYIKRMFDIILSGIGIILLIPIWITIPVLIKRDDGGKVFYRAPRIGKDKKIILYVEISLNERKQRRYQEC